MMSANLAQLKQTLGLTMLKSGIATQAAQATAMLEDFTRAQQTAQTPHPTLGRQLDVKL